MLAVCITQGNEAMHSGLRQRLVKYIEEREADFAPFVEDDEPFGTYVARMKKVRHGRQRGTSLCSASTLPSSQASPREAAAAHPQPPAPTPTSLALGGVRACLQDGQWAGYMEVVAASQALGVNLTIYQVGLVRPCVPTACMQPQATTVRVLHAP